MHKNIFITGTDTNIGKTLISCSLLTKSNAAIGLKPISTGAKLVNGTLQQADTLALQKYSSIKLSHQATNPWCYEPPISPHIAAKLVSKNIAIADVIKHISAIEKQYPSYNLITEGAGGIYCPINYQSTMLDLIKALDWPVIVVIGLKLGCLNHSMLTIKQLEQENVKILGWIGNTIEPMLQLDNNIATLKYKIPHPCLGIIPWLGDIPSIKQSAGYINL